MNEFARVTCSLPLSPGCMPAAARTAASIATASNATINLYWSPWQDPARWQHGHNASWTGPDERATVAHFKSTLLNVSRSLGSEASRRLVTVILLDSETFYSETGVEMDPAAVDRKHNLITAAAKAVFPGIFVERFDRGAVRHSENDDGMPGGTPADDALGGGWIDVDYYSLKERGDSFGVNLYTVSEIGYMREAFNRTVAQARATGEPCSQKPCAVTPWLALGCGFRRSYPRSSGDPPKSHYPSMCGTRCGTMSESTAGSWGPRLIGRTMRPGRVSSPTGAEPSTLCCTPLRLTAAPRPSPGGQQQHAQEHCDD